MQYNNNYLKKIRSNMNLLFIKKKPKYNTYFSNNDKGISVHRPNHNWSPHCSSLTVPSWFTCHGTIVSRDLWSVLRCVSLILNIIWMFSFRFLVHNLNMLFGDSEKKHNVLIPMCGKAVEMAWYVFRLSVTLYRVDISFTANN